jgi:hypothetical protein
MSLEGNMKKSVIILFLFLALYGKVFSQELLHPNFAMKSHETLELLKIDIQPGKTVMFMSIENRIPGGNFCADKNISIIYPSGEKLKITEASGIPVCPKTYNFKSIGEKLFFALVFPPMKPGTEWVDVVEECSSNCFWFYGVTLDAGLNRRIEEAFAAASTGKPEDNIMVFRKLLDEIGERNTGIEGLVYINIINAAIGAGDNVEAAVWYKRLQTSGAPRLNYYLKFLNDKGIKY